MGLEEKAYFWVMSFGQSIECWNWCWMSNICYCHLFNCSRVLQFGAHSRYYKCGLTQKRSFLVICTNICLVTFRSSFHVGWKNQNKHSTLNLSFDALSKWHEPDIRKYFASLTFRCKLKNFFTPLHCGYLSAIIRSIYCIFLWRHRIYK